MQGEPVRSPIGYSLSAIAVCVIGLVSLAWTAPGLKRLEWTDPLGRQPTGYKAWATKNVARDEVTHTGKVLQTGFSNVVEVAVNAEVYPDLGSELAQYTGDLVAAGYTVRIDTVRGSSPAVLRTLLQGIADLKGVLLVGELPVAWYEDDWGGSAPEEFPCDLYFADLNGTFLDSDLDGLYDDHTGNVAPEIWVGRLHTRSLTWDDEVRLLKRYFYKNHLYRTGGLALPDRGLCFNDEDWSGSGNCGLTAIYPSVTVIEDSRTTAPNYRTELVNGYEWIHVMSHSSAWGNTFRSASSNYTGTVFNCEMYALQPRCHFYNLFACSGARFVEENYSAGWEVFNDDWGLFAVGSTKTGSMMGYFSTFYSSIGSGNCVGDAFKAWFTAYGEQSRDWHYGLALIGDPTLKPRHGAAYGLQLTANSPAHQFRNSQPSVVGRELSAVSRRSPPPDLYPLSTDFEVIGANAETDADPAVISAPDGKVWCVWVSGRTPANGRFDIYGAYYTPSPGWSPAMPIGTAYYWEYNPALGIDNQGRPVCVWSVFEDSYHYNLYYSCYIGSTWTSPQMMSEDPSEDMKATLTRDSSGRLWCFWQSRRDFSPDIFACYWNGSTWSAPQNVTHDSADDCWPAAVTDAQGRAWVFYTRYELGRSEIWGSYWNGASWVRSGPVSGTRHKALYPTGTQGDSLRVAWQDFGDGNGEIYTSCYNGSTWSAPENVSSIPGLDVHPAMASEPSGRPRIVWQSRWNGRWSLMTARRLPGEWFVTETMTDSFALNPQMCFSASDEVWIVWQNYRAGSNWEIMGAAYPILDVTERRAATPGSRLGLTPKSNPAVGSVALAYSAPDPAHLAVFDRNGRLAQDLGAVKGDGSAVSTGLAPGVYFARLTSGAQQVESKVVVTR